MANLTWPSIRGKRARFTRLDECGVPVIGAKSTLVTKGYISVTVSPEYEDATENAPKTADDTFAFVDRGKDLLKYLTGEIQFVGVDPEAYEMVSGNPIWTNAAGDAAGIKVGTYDDIDANFALELWSDIPGQVCQGAKAYGYFLLPFIGPARIGEIAIQAERAEFSLTNAITKDANSWGVGPYNVELNDADPAVPAKLNTPLTAKDHLVMFQTPVPPPAITAGAIALAA
ncbi:major tail protein [Gordonia phage Twister6]|uniref:Major tail protein n=11 Tax=Wizardvirus TaxID=2169658 RepID=A0A7D5G1G4_9CAUD|nr:major tail protein [Gordonia phage Twister6]YP_010096629.1 major tail protein [Gordonia phage Danyall]YP_010096724.1 major tail protein [Gordonia phage KimmyK]YP_010101984.1 major tail protein [Gordonia phage SmokingBunny]YP_010102082.1 major tail protein [Gordonia phage VanDeWege]YP_010102177.1 major tail protein [Gordonia phage Barb]YP_010102276.1 major tail protein [Gordonia phage Arri]YP_010103035.1 major tail protein [Gordonia phage RogerDodger]YP_010107658.1 major tail protein [Gor